jgi:hypothetical protein
MRKYRTRLSVTFIKCLATDFTCQFAVIDEAFIFRCCKGSFTQTEPIHIFIKNLHSSMPGTYTASDGPCLQLALTYFNETLPQLLLSSLSPPPPSRLLSSRTVVHSVCVCAGILVFFLLISSPHFNHLC